MSVLDAVGSIARFCVKSVEEGFSEKADIIKDCQAEAKWYGNEEFSSSIRQPSGGTTIPARKEISGASGDTAANSSAEASSAITVNTNK
jgi:hypothetical protein